MQLPPLNAPAELRRTLPAEFSGEADSDILVARGPFIILACGFLALDPKDRDALKITCPGGVLTPQEIETAVRRWREPVKAAH